MIPCKERFVLLPRGAAKLSALMAFDQSPHVAPMKTEKPINPGILESVETCQVPTHETDGLPNRLFVMLMGGVLLGASCCRFASSTSCVAALAGSLFAYQGLTGRLGCASRAPIQQGARDGIPDSRPLFDAEIEAGTSNRSPVEENL
jgi:hypothetical protein